MAPRRVRSQEQAVDQLIDINVELTDRERQGAAGQAFFEELLDPRFWFRRGDGTTVTRAAFIKGLADPGNASEILETEIRQIQVLGDQAFVEALVRLKGRLRGKEVDGTFRNLRLFERRAGAWRLVMWFNKALPVGER